LNDRKEKDMPREIIQPEGVFDPRPRFAQVTRIGNQIYVAGQTSVDAGGNLVGKGDIEAQGRQVFQNLRRCLQAAGADFEHVVKLTVFSTDLDAHLTTIMELRREYFSGVPITSTTVQVPRLVHPDWLLEIEAIAVVD